MERAADAGLTPFVYLVFATINLFKPNLETYRLNFCIFTVLGWKHSSIESAYSVPIPASAFCYFGYVSYQAEAASFQATHICYSLVHQGYNILLMILVFQVLLTGETTERITFGPIKNWNLLKSTTRILTHYYLFVIIHLWPSIGKTTAPIVSLPTILTFFPWLIINISSNMT